MKQDLALDLSLEEKRALHRIVRAMHDGECPSCHTLHPTMRQENGDELCPHCGFLITSEEVGLVMNEFSEATDRSLSIFLSWRKRRKAH